MANLRQQFVFFSATLGIVHHHVVLQRKSNLQRQSDQQPEVGSSEQLTLRVGKQNDAEVVLPGLNADCSNVANVFRSQHFLKPLESPPGECG